MNINPPVGIAAAMASFILASILQAQAQTELMVNGGFESGSNGWTMSGGAGAYSDGSYARSGTYYLWLGGALNENDAAYQTITIPSTATSATLSFYYNILSDEVDPVAYD